MPNKLELNEVVQVELKNSGVITIREALGLKDKDLKSGVLDIWV